MDFHFLDDVELEFEKEALNIIVDKAIERNTGARGLRSIIEDIMRDIMFEIPSNPKIEELMQLFLLQFLKGLVVHLLHSHLL